MIESLKVFRDGGVNGTSNVLLLMLLDEPVGMTELAEAVGITTGAMTQTRDRLVELGLVEEVRDDKDRRRISIKRTQKGSNLVRRALACLS